LAAVRLVIAYTWGPVPVAEAIRKFAELKKKGVSGAIWEVDVGTGIMLAMDGRFDESRRLLEQARAVADDLGRPAWAGGILLGKGAVELIAGDAAQAERVLREGREEFLRVGEKGVLSTLSANLALTVCLQGRFDEAEPFIEESREFASTEDIASQLGWRLAKAMVLADRGELAEAELLAREAVALAMGGDALDDQGEALSALAQVLVAAGRSEEAGALLHEAIDRYERKGNVVSAGRARERLAAQG
jgi:Flp pilus assembly protein TadD